MFKKIIATAALAASVCLPVFAGPDVAIKFDGPSGQGQMITYAPKNGATNSVCATNGAVTFPSAVVASSTLNVTGASAFTGIASFTAVPNFKAALTAAGTLTNGPVSTKLPATTSNTNGVWLTLSGNGTNYAVLVYPQ